MKKSQLLISGFGLLLLVLLAMSLMFTAPYVSYHETGIYDRDSNVLYVFNSQEARDRMLNPFSGIKLSDLQEKAQELSRQETFLTSQPLAHYDNRRGTAEQTLSYASHGGSSYEIEGLQFRSGVKGFKVRYDFPVPSGQEATAVYKVKVEEVNYSYQDSVVSEFSFKLIRALEDPFIMAEYKDE